MGAAISVVIPAYNAALTIERAINSAQVQTRPPSEIIVVDDGSTDNTFAIVERLAAADNRVRPIRQTNRGQIIARNIAIAASTGTLIAPIDSDDIWHPDYLWRTGAALEADVEAGFAYALYRVIDENDNVIHDGPDFSCDGHAFVRHTFVNFVGNGSGALFRRGVLDEVGCYPVDAQNWGGAEDYLLQLRIASSYRVVRVAEYLVGYRRSPGSYSAQLPLAAHHARLTAVKMASAEAGERHCDVIRWVDADGRRVAAALLAKQQKVALSIRVAAPALILDPLATIMDIAVRTLNAYRVRMFYKSGSPAVPFFNICPTERMGPPVDFLRLLRLTKLSRRERTHGLK